MKILLVLFITIMLLLLSMFHLIDNVLLQLCLFLIVNILSMLIGTLWGAMSNNETLTEWYQTLKEWFIP